MTIAPEHLVRRRAHERRAEVSPTKRTVEHEPAASVLDLHRTAGNQAIAAALSSPSQPLDKTVRAQMEERTGADLSRVRVHAGATAADSARALDAEAYTVGRDIVFAAGRFDPTSARGQSLLAHELAHVVQQRMISEPQLEVAPEGDVFERSAERVAAGDAVQLAPLQVSAAAVQRQPASTATPPAQQTAARRPQISEEERGEMKADIETIVGELRSSFFTDEWKIVGLLLKWSDRDRVFTEQTGYPGTDYLDAFLLQAKLRAYSRHTAGSAWVERWGIVYDDVWHELDGQRRRTWKETVAKSQKQGTDGPREGPPENFWKTLSRQEAIGMWGVLKGMGTAAATGLVDAPATAIVKALKQAGIPVENPESAAAWLAKQYDISGEAMFSKDWSQGDQLLLGMSAADIGTTGGAVIWQLVMLGRGKGNAAWATNAFKALGIIGDLDGVATSAAAIAAMIGERQKAGKAIEAGELLADPRFRQEASKLAANIVGLVSTAVGMRGGGKPDAAAVAVAKAWSRVGIALDAAKLAERLGSIVQVGLSDKPAGAKDKEIAGLVADVIHEGIGLGSSVHSYHEQYGTQKPAPPSQEQQRQQQEEQQQQQRQKTQTQQEQEQEQHKQEVPKRDEEQQREERRQEQTPVALAGAGGGRVLGGGGEGGGPPPPTDPKARRMIGTEPVVVEKPKATPKIFATSTEPGELEQAARAKKAGSVFESQEAARAADELAKRPKGTKIIGSSTEKPPQEPYKGLETPSGDIITGKGQVVPTTKKLAVPTDPRKPVRVISKSKAELAKLPKVTSGTERAPSAGPFVDVEGEPLRKRPPAPDDTTAGKVVDPQGREVLPGPGVTLRPERKFSGKNPVGTTEHGREGEVLTAQTEYDEALLLGQAKGFQQHQAFDFVVGGKRTQTMVLDKNGNVLAKPGLHIEGGTAVSHREQDLGAKSKQSASAVFDDIAEKVDAAADYPRKSPSSTGAEDQPYSQYTLVKPGQRVVHVALSKAPNEEQMVGLAKAAAYAKKRGITLRLVGPETTP